MAKINENYRKLTRDYLFLEVGKRAAAYQERNRGKALIYLGIGDVTKPLVPAVVRALKKAAGEMGRAGTFRGYAPEQGYEFLRNAIAKNDYQDRGCAISPDEIFISDGAKSDCANIQEIFGKENKAAVCSPTYPVYVDTNVMAGRAGVYDASKGRWKNLIYLPCVKENGFVPEFPKETPDIIYFCFPNNPTGAGITKARLQSWVDYANEKGSVILYDAAYEAYISTKDTPHTIYECEGARTCAAEIRSFSKNAGFTGLRLGAAVVPKELKCEGTALHSLWARRCAAKYNGAPYIVQRAGEAVYSKEGKEQLKRQLNDYMGNAKALREGLEESGYCAYGGTDAPYIWLKTPNDMSSWEFFDYLLERTGIVGIPGVGFGAEGEGYFRLSAFGSRQDILRAVKLIREI